MLFYLWDSSDWSLLSFSNLFLSGTLTSPLACLNIWHLRFCEWFAGKNNGSFIWKTCYTRNKHHATMGWFLLVMFCLWCSVVWFIIGWYSFLALYFLSMVIMFNRVWILVRTVSLRMIVGWDWMKVLLLLSFQFFLCVICRTFLLIQIQI